MANGNSVASTVNQPDLTGLIWDIANKLRGPYRPPQYRRVMLPMTVLRRLDCVLEPTKDVVLKEYEKRKGQGVEDKALNALLAKVASKERRQPLYNTSPYTFQKLLGDSDNIARNLVSYIKGFSPIAQEIFEKFEFEKEIEKLDNANRLFLIVKEFAGVDLHPDSVTNTDMGTIFENLVRRFNEQANEEAGDHFTPREVIELMAHLIYTHDEDVYKSGIARTIYDPACGTGGMLSVSEEYIRKQNAKAHLELFGQDYNNESYAICYSDLLIKDEPVDNIVHNDTLGASIYDKKAPGDGHLHKKFHYMLANPPFGVEWKPEQDFIETEYKTLGFSGRFGAGTPRITDGSLLFLQHMISKMNPSPEEGGEGSKIGIVFNGSPLFAGEPGPSESNIRRWIIENDWLDAIVALPDQLFYNTGIYTYIWLVTNRKRPERRGKVQLIDATRHYHKMTEFGEKSLGNKRNKLSEAHIKEIVTLYTNYEHNGVSKFLTEGKKPQERVCSKIFENHEFGYLKLTVERPLRLNFQTSPERIARLREQSAFKNLAESKKRKDDGARQAEIEAGQQLQIKIETAMASIDAGEIYQDREKFERVLDKALSKAGLKLPDSVRKAILTALSERDPNANECLDKKGNKEADTELRDTEIVPLPPGLPAQLPIGYEKDADNKALLALVQTHCDTYFNNEVKPYWPDAWIDYSKTKVGYEIPVNRHFYVYEPPRKLKDIEDDIKGLEKDILDMLKEVVA